MKKKLFSPKNRFAQNCSRFFGYFWVIISRGNEKKNSLGYDEHQKRKKKAEFSVICVAEIFLSTKNAPLACDYCKFLCQFLHIFCSISMCVFSFFGISKKKLSFQFSAVIQGGCHGAKMSRALEKSKTRKVGVDFHPGFGVFLLRCALGETSPTLIAV